MGKNLQQLLSEGEDGDTVSVTIVSNEDNGIASYAVGRLQYRAENEVHAGTTGQNIPRPAALETVTPLTIYFSNRFNDGPPAAEKQFGGAPQVQPFVYTKTDALGVSLSNFFGDQPELQLKFISWGGQTFDITTEARANLLVGTGPALGTTSEGIASSEALYVVAFTSIQRPL